MARALVLFALAGCAPDSAVACEGPRPVSCSCATRCVADLNGDVREIDLEPWCLPQCWRRDG